MNKHIQDFMSFLDASPTAFQASDQIVARLDGAGFTLLQEQDAWQIQPGGRYYVQRGDTAVIAFCIGSGEIAESGFHMAASHIDSPSLKLKPASIKTEGSLCRVGVEVYGGPILSTWIDRELGIAGRVLVKQDGAYRTVNVNLSRAVAIIPNAAIHLNRDINSGFEYNKQRHLLAILHSSAMAGDPLLAAVATELNISPENIVDMELFLYDVSPSRLTGLDEKLIVSGRLDNLAMTHAILSGICAAEVGQKSSMAVFYDSEEIGSQTPQGAFSSLLADITRRITLAAGLSEEEHYRALRNTFMISADMAHAYHPAYADKYEPDYSPQMNKGPVIKLNANHRYASTAKSAAAFHDLCAAVGVSCQRFLVRSDMPCGSTVGPIVAANMGIEVVDIGNPMWAMHSARETAGVCDHRELIKVLTHYYENK